MTEVRIPIGTAEVVGNLDVPGDASGLVIFAHGSGSSRFSRRNRQVAASLQKAGFGTLLMDLLTAEEDRADAITAEFRFNIPLLAERLAGATVWARSQETARDLRIGYFGASTGAAAALIAAAQRPDDVAALVSRGGRPDLAGKALGSVQAPTLLIVGSLDAVVIGMNREAAQKLRCENKTVLVPGATHLFEEPGALEQVSTLAQDWFSAHLHRGTRAA